MEVLATSCPDKSELIIFQSVVYNYPNHPITFTKSRWKGKKKQANYGHYVTSPNVLKLLNKT